MKKIIFAKVIGVIFILLVILFSACNQPQKVKEEQVEQAENKILEGNIKINVSADLFSLTDVWVKNFKLKNSNININLIKSDSLDINESNSLLITTSFTNNYKNSLKIKIAKDIIVPIFNENNPYIQELVYKGVKSEELYEILFIGNIKFWSQLVESKKGKEPIIIYRRKDNAGATTAIKNYLNSNNKKMIGKVMNNDLEIIEIIKSNQMGLSFCSFNNAYTKGGNYRTRGIYILPIDRNSNDIVDDIEHNFDRKDILLNAYNKGTYPKELTVNTYVFTHSELKDKAVVFFVNWLLGEGQNYLEQFGLIPLIQDEVKEEKLKLRE